MKDFLQHLGIKVIRPEGDNQLLCECPWCGKPKLYVDKTTGLWKCQRNCDSGNLYQLAEKRTDMDSKTIMALLERYRLSGTDRKTETKERPSKPRLKKSDAIPLTGNDLAAFCEIKGISQDAYSRLVGTPWRHKVKPWALIPGWNPSAPDAACAIMRVHLEGKLIKTRNGEDKYPLIAGSRHGLIGVPWLLKERPEVLIFCEGWRDAVAAVQAGFYATASTGGASCFKDEWLPLFAKKKVYICFDADEVGVYAAQRAALKIWDVGKEVHIINLPYEVTENHGKDLYDWLTEENATKAPTVN